MSPKSASFFFFFTARNISWYSFTSPPRYAAKGAVRFISSTCASRGRQNISSLRFFAASRASLRHAETLSFTSAYISFSSFFGVILGSPMSPSFSPKPSKSRVFPYSKAASIKIVWPSRTLSASLSRPSCSRISAAFLLFSPAFVKASAA